MKNFLLLFVLILISVSCTQEKKFPDLKTQRIPDEKLTLIELDTIRTSVTKQKKAENKSLPECLKNLVISAINYRQKNESFSLGDFKEKWKNCKAEVRQSEWNNESLSEWINTTGLLLQLTAEEKYAAELERITINTSNKELKYQAASYVFTQNVDHLHVNLFIPVKVEYDHSLSGKVEVRLETGYPANGKTELKFSMGKKRYIELQVRIPEWATDAQVTVKGVKYFAPAGNYCFIAKQWKDGDSVEIVFPSIHNQLIN